MFTFTIRSSAHRNMQHASGSCCMRRAPTVHVRALTVPWRSLNSGKRESLGCRSVLLSTHRR